MKYVLTILNSRIAQFYVEKKWNSLKVLRSHLEEIPIPVISKKEQEYFVRTANQLMNIKQDASLINTFNDLYNQLDLAIAGLYGITDEEYSLIQTIK